MTVVNPSPPAVIPETGNLTKKQHQLKKLKKSPVCSFDPVTKNSKGVQPKVSIVRHKEKTKKKIVDSVCFLRLLVYSI